MKKGSAISNVKKDERRHSGASEKAAPACRIINNSSSKTRQRLIAGLCCKFERRLHFQRRADLFLTSYIQIYSRVPHSLRHSPRCDACEFGCEGRKRPLKVCRTRRRGGADERLSAPCLSFPVKRPDLSGSDLARGAAMECTFFLQSGQQ